MRLSTCRLTFACVTRDLVHSKTRDLELSIEVLQYLPGGLGLVQAPIGFVTVLVF